MSKQGGGFRLEFAGLKEGKHTFAYVLEQEFMELYPEADVFCEPQVRVELEMEKRERMMLLSFRFSGTAGTACDRCLRPLRFGVEVQEEIIVKTASAGESDAQDEENLWWVSEKDTAIDLAPYFYETIALSRPLQVFCPEDETGAPTCDPAMLHLYEQPSGQQEPETDPRWDALKKLKR
ncbi:MAG: DUF177 domain-containing protein [Bacteroides sp.]|nr:DUF177 domain-containing protein [Bacteroides sp.]MCM1084979.1 DUF177 domain-containing protein [Bacteroides sp.]MCM1170213.1 DUF177 domain-containing protein [Bacteroides sp.]